MTEPTLADSSAWIEFLRGTGSAVDRSFDALLADPDRLAVTDPVMMEVLAGARDQREWQRMRRLFGRCRFEPVTGPSDYEDAALLYRRLRGVGLTVTSMIDCLIAVVAMRTGLTLLHADHDFDAIAEHAPLRTA